MFQPPTVSLAIHKFNLHDMYFDIEAFEPRPKCFSNMTTANNYEFFRYFCCSNSEKGIFPPVVTIGSCSKYSTAHIVSQSQSIYDCSSYPERTLESFEHS